MKQELVDEIIACMPKERTLFRYFKDRYALMLLSYMTEKNINDISDIKKSDFSGLLARPFVKEHLHMMGGGKISKELIQYLWPHEVYNFVLTVSKWNNAKNNGGQTSRRGHNLVLQLNFSNQHDVDYKDLVKPECEQLLNYYGHPILETDERQYFHETLAWARIDLDFDTNEALIEEVQSDWIRRAKRLYSNAVWYKKRRYKKVHNWDVMGDVDSVIKYYEENLIPYKTLWDEAMLAASIDFIRNELGIEKIHYHSVKTGPCVKRISYTRPPISLYEKLPKRFCFKKSAEAPEFLQSDKEFRRLYKKLRNPEWFNLAV